MNVPNLLTILRVLMAVVMGLSLRQEGIAFAVIALFLFVLASLTDALDGYWARKYGQVTIFGKIMDPVADKVLTLTAFFVLAVQGVFSGWMVGLIALREVLVTLWRIVSMVRGVVLPAEGLGKIKTVFQMGTILFVLLWRVLVLWPPAMPWTRDLGSLFTFLAQGLMIGAVLITVISGAAYLFPRSKGCSSCA
ncbi:MAG: CDP-diacylglycerol--glycerol-3-phosphate 3-phosphatidyltransferase [Elusimicrobia bacterium]|nr:CDP-diacylglycerol--glycerol-3-phosphate 3-phosphatidyltransferase [Elusimicrobiota bacterium]